MPSEISAVLRRNPPGRWQHQLLLRVDADRPFDPAKIQRGDAVMLDTTVYIDQLKGKLPPQIEGAVARGRTLHSATALGEIGLTTGFLDPTDRRTADNRRVLERLLDNVQDERIFAPTPAVCLEAAVLAGIFARVMGVPKDARRKLLNDALILLTARSVGATLISRNIDDMDRLNQMRPDTKFLLYRV